MSTTPDPDDAPVAPGPDGREPAQQDQQPPVTPAPADHAATTPLPAVPPPAPTPARVPAMPAPTTSAPTTATPDTAVATTPLPATPAPTGPLPGPTTPAGAPHLEGPPPGAEPTSARARRRRRPVAVIVLSVALAAALALAGYLFTVAEQWQERSEELTAVSTDLGADLATTQARLDGAHAELEAVRGQLATAQERIIELADEKAQLGDDREVQRQLADYQARVSSAAGNVASALDECIQGQQMLIGYLENRDDYDPDDLERFQSDVDRLCQSATDANLALQRELSQ